MYVTAYNVTGSPVAATDEGHTIGGHGWGTADTTSDAGRHAFDAGILVEIEEPGDNARPEARDAWARTQEVSKRAETFGDADKAKLLEAARTAGLVGPDDEPHKPELVAMLATRPELEVDLGSTRKRSTKADTDTQEG